MVYAMTPMSFKIIINGMPVWAETVKEAHDLATFAAKTASNRDIIIRHSGSENSRISAAFKALMTANGVLSFEDLAKALDLDGTNGIGPFVRVLKRVLRERGIGYEDVFEKAKTSTGKNGIARGPRFQEAVMLFGDSNGH